MQGKWRH